MTTIKRSACLAEISSCFASCYVYLAVWCIRHEILIEMSVYTFWMFWKHQSLYHAPSIALSLSEFVKSIFCVLGRLWHPSWWTRYQVIRRSEATCSYCKSTSHGSRYSLVRWGYFARFFSYPCFTNQPMNYKATSQPGKHATNQRTNKQTKIETNSQPTMQPTN